MVPNFSVGEGDTLKLGKHTLTFITAHMVHWPEVILSYESTTETKHSTNWPLSQGNFPSHPLSTPESSKGVGIST